MVLVLIDTPIWSLALRRAPVHLSPAEQQFVARWQQLVAADNVILLGAVRQEILSGIRTAEQFEKLRTRLRVWPDEPQTIDDYEQAAHCSNICRAAGIAHSNVDILICAVAVRRGYEILSTDPDFARYAKVLPIRLVPHPAT